MLLLILSVQIYASPIADESISVPVIVGGHDGMDACLSLGVVRQGGFVGDYVDVRAGPSSKYEHVTQLVSGSYVWVCNTQDLWLAIVFSTAPKMDCWISQPINHEQAYAGPCQFGWVPESAIEIIAG